MFLYYTDSTLSRRATELSLSELSSEIPSETKQIVEENKTRILSEYDSFASTTQQPCLPDLELEVEVLQLSKPPHEEVALTATELGLDLASLAQ
jgi:hypothetical protein